MGWGRLDFKASTTEGQKLRMVAFVTVFRLLFLDIPSIIIATANVAMGAGKGLFNLELLHCCAL